MINAKQQAVIDTIRNQLLHEANIKHDGTKWERQCEVKKLTVDDTTSPHFVFLVLTIGGVDDAGTMAAVYCRNTRHVQIGTRGGCKLLNAKPKRNVTAYHKTKPQGIWNAIHAITE